MTARLSARGSAFLIALVCVLQGCAGSTSAIGSRNVSDGEAAQANLNLGVAYVRQGRPDLAIPSLVRALEQDPRLADAHSTIAIAYDQIGSDEDAERHYRRATQLDPANAAAANSYAVFLCRQDRWKDAEPYFRRATENPRYPTRATALTNAGLCAKDSGDVAKAEEWYRAALAEDGASPGALAGLMELSYQQENYLQARAFMQRYLDNAQPSAAVLWLCFNIEQALDDANAAERCATQLRQNFPQSSEFAQLRQFESDARR
jgi:type IV pilus assembly protein PilF